MAAWAGGRLLAAVALLVCVPLCVWTLNGGPLRLVSEATRPYASHQPGSELSARRVRTPGPKVPGADALPAGLLAGTVIVLACLGAAVAGLVVSRLRARQGRRLERFWLLPSRTDEATPEAVAAMLRAWHEQLARRWWQRALQGQPGLSLEVHAASHDGAPRALIVLAVPEGTAPALSGPLNATYPDVRLIPCELDAGEWPALVRLEKRDRFVRRLATPERAYDPPPIHALLHTMAEAREGAVVQLAIIPAPSVVERLARGLLRARESQVGREHASSARVELDGGQAMQWAPLWCADIRVAGGSWEACARIAGALRAGSAENRLRERRVVLGRERARRRLLAGIGDPVPHWLTGVLSCAELAGLWQLPSPALRGVGFERSSVPRAVAPPQVLRPTDRVQALGRDDVGYVGLHAADLEKNLALIGQIGSGKTSVLAQSTERDAHDPDACVIVIDPNSTGVAAHLSAIPPERTVHVLDVAAPECGFNPLLASGAVSKVADDLVEAFVDVHDTGEIMTSSRQFLGGAAEAVIGAHRHGALDHDPSLWDLYRVLLPNQRAFRSQLLDAIGSDRELLGAATLLGEDIPQGLRDIGAQYALRMSAPRNKLFQMRSRNIDRVLRHPRQLNLREIIERREMLVVDGRMGSTGVAQTRVLVMFLLNLIFAELRRQMELPPQERARVCLKLDEGHLVIGEHFATALSTLRAGGLQTTVCYQYSAQLRDEVVRAGAGSLLASRCVFQLSELQDAEQMARMAMSAYASSVSDDPRSRARMGITPDTILHLPRHWAICSWQAQGARVGAFAMNTLRLAEDERRIAHHLAQQRERGGFVPETLPHPLQPAGEGATEDPLAELEAAERSARSLPEVEYDEAEREQLDGLMRANGTPEPRALRDRGTTARVAAIAGPATAVSREPERPAEVREVAIEALPAAGAASDDADERSRLEHVQAEVLARATAAAGSSATGRPRHATGRSSVAPRRPARQTAPATAAPSPPRSPASASGQGAVPERYLEVQIEPSALVWDDAPVEPAAAAPAPDGRQLAVLSALHRLGPLLSSQLEREFYDGVGERTVQRSLTAMKRAGWVRRFRLRERQGRGQPPYVYVLDRRGFDVARDVPGPARPYIPRDARFFERRFESVLKPLHDLHANALLFALLHHMPKAARGWRGPADSVIRPPRRRPRGEEDRPVRADEIPLESPLRLKGIQLESFEAIKPDLTIEVVLHGRDRRRRFDLLIELDRSGNPRSDSNTRKLLRYDAMLSGWHVLVERYRQLGHSPIVVVACADEPTAKRWAHVADELLTGCVTRMGDPDAEAAFHGRKRMFFATELDLHRGLLRGYRVPRYPRELRYRLAGAKAARRVELQHITFLPDRFLR